MEELMILNPRRHRRRRRNTPARRVRHHYRHRRRANPVLGFNPSRRRHHRRRRNPSLLRGITSGGALPMIVTGAVGAIGSTIVSKYILDLFKAEDKGIMSYVGRLGGGMALAMAGGLITKKPSVRQGIMVGTGIAVAAKVINDLVGGTSLIGMPSNLGAVRLPTIPSYGYRKALPAFSQFNSYRKNRWE